MLGGFSENHGLFGLGSPHHRIILPRFHSLKSRDAYSLGLSRPLACAAEANLKGVFSQVLSTCPLEAASLTGLELAK